MNIKTWRYEKKKDQEQRGIVASLQHVEKAQICLKKKADESNDPTNTEK